MFLIRADGVIDWCNLANKCKKGDLQAFPAGLKADTAKEGSIAALFVLIIHISEAKVPAHYWSLSLEAHRQT